MNTDNGEATQQSQSNNQSQDPQQTVSTVDSNTVQALSQLMEELQSIDINSPEAKLNETSISDGNGGRIDLNEDPADPNVTKK